MTVSKKPSEYIEEKGENAGGKIFSFSQNVLNPVKDKNLHFSKYHFVVCKYFQFRPF